MPLDLVCPIISTPNERDFRSVIRYSIAGGLGANIIFPFGENGDFRFVSFNDRQSLAEIAIDEVQKQNDVLDLPFKIETAIGITATNLDNGRALEETIELAQHAEAKGADYIVFAPICIQRTASNGFTTRRTLENIDAVLSATDEVSFMIYNNPHIAGDRNVPNEIMRKVSKYGRFVAMKDSSGSLRRAIDYKQAIGDNGKFYFGDEIIGLHNPSMCEGVVAGSANIFPAMWRAALTSESSPEIMELKNELTRLQRFYADNSIDTFKRVLAELGVAESGEFYNFEEPLVGRKLTAAKSLMGQESFELFTSRNLELVVN